MVQFYTGFTFVNLISLCFKLIIHYHSHKQRKIKFEPRIKLNHSTYTLLQNQQHSTNYGSETLGSLCNGAFEQCASTGSGLFLFLGNVFAKIFGQIVCTRVKKHDETNVVTSWHIKRQKALLPFEVRCSRMLLLKLPIIL